MTEDQYTPTFRRRLMGDVIRVIEDAGVPWVHHGRKLEEGLDCGGFVAEVFRYAGLPIDDLDIPYSQADTTRAHRFRAAVGQLAKRFDKVDEGRPEDGDVMVVRNATHLGVYHDGHLYHFSHQGLRKAPWHLIQINVTQTFRHRALSAGR
jgi:cell wall-associated NlpC family hydrolase